MIKVYQLIDNQNESVQLPNNWLQIPLLIT